MEIVVPSNLSSKDDVFGLAGHLHASLWSRYHTSSQLGKKSPCYHFHAQLHLGYQVMMCLSIK